MVRGVGFEPTSHLVAKGIIQVSSDLLFHPNVKAGSFLGGSLAAMQDKAKDHSMSS